MKRAASLFLAGLLVTLGACSHTTTPPERIVARGDDFVLTQSELGTWSDFLKKRRDFRLTLRRAESPREEIARTAAVTAILLQDYPDLVSDEERRRLWRGMADHETRRTYVREVLGPQIVVDEAGVREIFETHRENYRKARGVKALEIFLWAPENLEDLRDEKILLLENIRTTTTTPEAFRQAAQAHSDATSSFRGGSIGTVLEDQIGGALRQALFTTTDGLTRTSHQCSTATADAQRPAALSHLGVLNGLSSTPPRPSDRKLHRAQHLDALATKTGEKCGLTDIVQSPDGLFLFWVVRRVPAKENDFEDVASGIEAKLRKQKMQILITADSQTLRTRHAFTVIDPSEPTDPDAPVLRIDDRLFTLRDLDLDIWDRRAVDRRGMAILYREALQERVIAIDQPDHFEVDWLLSRRILSLLIAQAPEVGAPPVEAGAEQPEMMPSKVERWTFDLLTVEGISSPEALFAVFRAQYEIGETADLKMLQEALENGYGLKATIEPFDDVPASSVGGLGPEIHTTIKKRLSEGEMSKPMHLSDRHQVVVIVLKQKRLDEQAGLAATESSAKRRSHKDCEDRISDQLLQAHNFRFTPES